MKKPVAFTKVTATKIGGKARPHVVLTIDYDTFIQLRDVIPAIRKTCEPFEQSQFGFMNILGTLNMLSHHKLWERFEYTPDEIMGWVNTFSEDAITRFISAVLSEVNTSDLTSMEALIGRHKSIIDNTTGNHHIEILLPDNIYDNMVTVLRCYQDVFGQHAKTVNKIHSHYKRFMSHVAGNELGLPADVAMFYKRVETIADGFKISDVPFYDLGHVTLKEGYR
jgi:hypothetical protein